ncbi:hypothetical protein [Planomonospora venezuelensis]|uniref:Gram-positive cocci surface proteins LPxTG domain-containing protein n=1 Tax=Planomonospora venezuelensis TaxID=1999 RepID=A0A841D8S5_PLAVE|nr:hypothetical protein [Planomonospora venezuelensis]MBB5963816.1 hypothetical protein [Planomonospora venezuelensis]GIM99602.1 hypothetical protein Pve01_12610 [Planomonospora venezuelensis]
MLKPKTRRRVMAKTAAIAAVGAGVLFGAVPAVASMVTTMAPKPVTYDCTVPGGAAATYKVQLDLTGPLNPVPSSTIVATWKIGPSASPAITAPSAIPTSDRIIVEGDVLITSSPLAVPSEARQLEATGAAVSVAAGATITPPNLLITMTPTATGVIAVQPDAFTLYVMPSGGTESELLNCAVSTAAAAEATAAALLITVKPSTASTGTPTNTGTGTATPTPTNTATSSVKPTITVFETVTAKPTAGRTRQIEKTPGGGAATGGGGDAGPDARVIMLSGALMIAGAAAGGLALRRRTASRG